MDRDFPVRHVLEEPGKSAEIEISLRDARAEDAEFLYHVYAGTRGEELAMTNWSEAQKTQFCRMQFQAQTTDYQRNYPKARYSVIERNGDPVGRLIVDRLEREISIIDIALLPAARGAGIGTRLLRELMEEAGRGGMALSIYVEKFNRALQLYLRLGFLAVEDQGVYLRMEWKDGEKAEQPNFDVQ